MNLENIPLSEKTKSNLLLIGYDKLTDIQKKIIPLVLEGKDVIGQSGTGTGKTASFIIPIVEKLKPLSKPQALILTPTRELALQVSEEAKKLSRHLGLKTLAVYGGDSITRQLKAFFNGFNDLIVGTPGRIRDFLERTDRQGRKIFSTDSLKFVVIDEVDEMISKGFLKEIEWIIKKTPANRQTSLYSATISSEVEKFSQRFMRDPQMVIANRGEIEENNIKQSYLETTYPQKSQSLLKFFVTNKPKSTIIFANTKREVEKIDFFLKKEGIRTDYIHSGLSQGRRTRVLSKFRNKQIPVLIATDVAARGIHVNCIDYVVNYEFPQSSEFYVHRIGRTGRAGASGEAITFVSSSKEKSRLISLSRQRGFKINRYTI